MPLAGETWPDRFDARHAVVALTLLALVVRLVGLGRRAVHWDEARVGYWILRSLDSGDWAYHAILHGPFVQHANRLLFPLVGANTFTMRLPVAVVGGCLPLAALLFRTRLDDAETVALAAAFALNPLLLYYSRFMRSDVLLATFAVVTLGTGLRLLDTRRPRWLYACALAFALAVTTKENALLYPMAWAGAATLVSAGHLRKLPAAQRRPAVVRRIRAVGTTAWAWRGHVALSLAMALAVIVALYAPRAGTPGAVGLWNALDDPALAPAVVGEATFGSWTKLSSLWLSGSMRDHTYLPYLGYFALVLAATAAPLSGMAVLGILDARTRPLVAFGGWWGLSSLVGYPYATDIAAPWLGVHVVVALAIPAAVGLVAVWRQFHRSRANGDRVVATIMLGLLLVSGASVAGVAKATSYTTPHGELAFVVQDVQPGSDLNPTMERAVAAAAGSDGQAVGYVGDLAVDDESDNDDIPAASNWYDRLPLPWYTEAADLTVTSVAEPAALGDEPPPVVIATPSDRRAVAARLPNHTAVERAIYLRPHPRTISVLGYEKRLIGRSVVIFIADGG